MQRLSVPTLAVLALAFAQAPALAQKATDSRAAVMPFGALGNDGQAAIGAGLRLFPTTDAPAVQPMPQPAPQPAAAATVAPSPSPASAPRRSRPPAAPASPHPCRRSASPRAPPAAPPPSPPTRP